MEPGRSSWLGAEWGQILPFSVVRALGLGLRKVSE